MTRRVAASVVATLLMVLLASMASWSGGAIIAAPLLVSGEDVHDHGSVAHLAPPESDRAYSLFMHRTSGAVVLILSALVFAERLNVGSGSYLRVGTGGVWLLLGLFLLIWADPEGWPVGPAGFWESFTLPTAGEWLQHKVLALVPALLGFFWIASIRRPWTWAWNYLLAGVAVIGALGLLRHQHAAHPGLDLVNVQHRLFAVTAVFIAAAFLVETWERCAWKHKRLLFPAGLLVLGMQLVFFRE